MDFVLGFVAGVATLALKATLDFYFERRRERRAVRAAARLVGHELGSASIWLHVVQDVEGWMSPEGWAFDHDTWRENKALLAAALNDRQWLSVASGYREVQAAETNMRADVREAGVDDPALTSDTAQLVRHGIVDLDRAAQVLQDVSTWRGRSRWRALRSRSRG